MKRIFVFTDGSSRGNPGPGGFGAAILIDDFVFEIGGKEEEVTNNQMEMQALIAALSFLMRRETKGAEVTFYTDSSYLLLGIQSLTNWVKNNWQTKTKENVKNRDRWEKIFDLLEKVEKLNKIKWQKVSSHQGVILNERVDLIATSFALNRPMELFAGTFGDYKKIFPAGEEFDLTRTKKPMTKRSHKSAYSYVSMVNGKIMTHKTWIECEKRVRGQSGARFRKALDAADEKHIIEEWSHYRG
ncbi:MAG TPA: ribonuclease H [Candidatus Paceibacterota bacterium]|nr:ribonuclease H [Candidatus Paceibacterota bacterium]